MKNLASLIFLAFSLAANAQVPKKVIVEHFTNTKCGACASRNPGFYTNLKAQSGVIHLAVHPSSPYSGCVLNQHNVSENDVRTNYYGVYGSTPRLVIQGAVVSVGANYSSSSIFTSYLGQQSPASIKIVQSKYGNDSIRSRIVIKTEATHTLGSLSLFVALAEDTLNYTGSNGESVHYDVFRKSLTGASGVSVTLPVVVGDSVVYTKSSASNAGWNFSKIFTLAILQETASKAVVQSQSVPAGSTNIKSGVSKLEFLKTNVKVYSSQKTVFITQNQVAENLWISIYDISGKVLYKGIIDSKTKQVDLGDINKGIYLYNIKTEGKQAITGKVYID